MTDVLTREQRSHCMSRIRSKNTEPELAVRRALWLAGYHFRLHRADLPGKPDIVFPAFKLVLFVDGCFFHGCPKHSVRPRTNTSFWRNKVEGNVRRDRLVGQSLRAAGWRVLRVWEHQVRQDIRRVVQRVSMRVNRSIVEPQVPKTLVSGPKSTNLPGILASSSLERSALMTERVGEVVSEATQCPYATNKPVATRRSPRRKR